MGRGHVKLGSKKRRGPELRRERSGSSVRNEGGERVRIHRLEKLKNPTSSDLHRHKKQRRGKDKGEERKRGGARNQ